MTTFTGLLVTVFAPSSLTSYKKTSYNFSQSTDFD